MPPVRRTPGTENRECEGRAGLRWNPEIEIGDHSLFPVLRGEGVERGEHRVRAFRKLARKTLSLALSSSAALTAGRKREREDGS